MGFIRHHEGVGGQVIVECGRRLSGVAAGEIARVVFDAGAVAHFPDHFHVVAGALLEALGFDEAVFAAQILEPLGEFPANLVDGVQQGFLRGHIVRFGEHRQPRHFADDAAGERVEIRQPLDFIVVQLDADGVALGFGGVDVDDVAAHSVGGAAEFHVVAGVLQLREPPQQVALVDAAAAVEVNDHLQPQVRVAEAVNRRNRRHHDDIGALEQRLGRQQPHLFDMVVDRGVFFDVQVRGGNIGLGLVIVVVGNEIFDGVGRKELAELAVELGREGLVGRHHQRWPLHLFNDIGDGEGLARASHPEQGLGVQPVPQPIHEAADRLGLVPRRREPRLKPESPLRHLSGTNQSQRKPSILNQ